MTERELVLEAKSEEPGALEALYRLYPPKLLRTAHRIARSHEGTEDAVHDSFLNALRHLKSFEGRSTLSTWLTRIGINSSLMILRKKRNSQEKSIYDSAEDEPMWEVPDSAPNPETQYAQREVDRLVRSALQNLSPRFRRAIEIQMFQGNSLDQTALQRASQSRRRNRGYCAPKWRCANRRLPELKLPMMATRDVGDYAAQRLLDLDFSGKQTRELLGERDLSMAEATAIIARSIGKPDLRYVQFPYDQMQQALEQMGLPPTKAAMYIEMFKAINNGVLAAQEPRSRENTTTTSFEKFVQDVFATAYHGAAATA
jgi:RNA polymerase sigma factor (sigma-70 family)